MNLKYKVVSISIILSLLLWIIDAVVDSFVFQMDSFLNSLIFRITVEEFYMRSITIVYFIIIGFILSRIMNRQRQAEEALRANKEKYQSLFECASDSIFIVDIETRHFLDVNNNAAERLSYTKEELLNLKIEDISISYPVDRLESIIQDMNDGKSIVLETIHLRKDGSKMPVEVSSRVIEYKGRQVIQTFARDITARKKAEEMLEEAACTDMLTGLSNRRDFSAKFKGETSRFNRNNKPFSIIMGDIDFFKKINDMYGHDCGDSVLKNIAEIMKSSLRLQDVVCRWGGEEFVIMLTETDLAGGKKYAEILRKKISSNTFYFNNIAIKTTMCFGVAVYDHLMTIEKVISIADKSMYKAKSEGRNCVITSDDLQD